MHFIQFKFRKNHKICNKKRLKPLGNQ